MRALGLCLATLALACTSPRPDVPREELFGAWTMEEVRGEQEFGTIDSSLLSFADDGTLAGWMRTRVDEELRLSTTNGLWRIERGRLWVNTGLEEAPSRFWFEGELLVIEDDTSGLRLVYRRAQ